jgi:hypothetical protein
LFFIPCATSHPILPLQKFNVVATGRPILKRGEVEIVTIANKKISKRSVIDVVLLTDLFIYGKPETDKKSGLLISTALIYRSVSYVKIMIHSSSWS